MVKKTLPRTREYECIVCACDCLKEAFHMVRTAQGTHGSEIIWFAWVLLKDGGHIVRTYYPPTANQKLPSC